MDDLVTEAAGTGNAGLGTPVLLGSLAFGILSFLLPVYGKRLGANAIEIGGLFSIFSLISMTGRLVAGLVIDKVNKKIFFIAALVFYALAWYIYSMATSMDGLYAARFVQAIGSSFMWISVYTIAVNFAGREAMGRAIGAVDEASSRGSLLGAILGFVIVDQMPFIKGWELLFKGYAVLSLVAALIAYKRMPAGKTGPVKKDRVQAWPKIQLKLVKLLFIVLLNTISASMLAPLLMIFLQDRFTRNVGTLAMAFIPAAIIYSVFPSKAGIFSDKAGRVLPIVIGMLSSGIISFLFVNIHSIHWLILLWVLEAIGIVLASPAEKALVAELAGDNRLGRGYGLYQFTLSLGTVIGPLLGGFLYDHYNYAVPFYLNGVILLANGVLSVFLLREKDEPLGLSS